MQVCSSHVRASVDRRCAATVFITMLALIFVSVRLRLDG